MMNMRESDICICVSDTLCHNPCSNGGKPGFDGLLINTIQRDCATLNTFNDPHN